ncbi:MAG: hypothetical protein PHR32_02710, partial [Candidatus Cloacimonetes bacterium]|nr:hypothetical protein [Candidatus Cloacimonadota bacterium]
MLYNEISAQLKHSQFFAGLLPLKRGTQIYHLNHSARALVAAHLWAETGKDIILVSQDDIIAEDLWEDLVTLVGRDHAYYLPDY